MILEIKKNETTEFIEVNRVEDTKDRIYYDVVKYEDKKDCEYIKLHLNSYDKILYKKIT